MTSSTPSVGETEKELYEEAAKADDVAVVEDKDEKASEEEESFDDDDDKDEYEYEEECTKSEKHEQGSAEL